MKRFSLLFALLLVVLFVAPAPAAHVHGSFHRGGGRSVGREIARDLAFGLFGGSAVEVVQSAPAPIVQYQQFAQAAACQQSAAAFIEAERVRRPRPFFFPRPR